MFKALLCDNSTTLSSPFPLTVETRPPAGLVYRSRLLRY
nr:MAG TPA: hypothetical protein [Caudoviricetes sp.]